jgi:hypothetical protein
MVFFLVSPNLTDLGALSSSGIFVIGTILFVLACYPSEKKHENYVLPIMLRIFGAQTWVVKHIANDWLAGTWFFFWANFLFTMGAFFLLIDACARGNPKEIFVWLSSASNSFLFMVGSFYYVAGSYPHASQFYYVHQNMNDKEKSIKRKLKKQRSMERKGLVRVKKRVRKDIEVGLGDDDAMNPLLSAPLNSYTPQTVPTHVTVGSNVTASAAIPVSAKLPPAVARASEGGVYEVIPSRELKEEVKEEEVAVYEDIGI